LDYPNDADRDALRRVASDGSDMSKPMEIDFAISAPSEDAVKAIAHLAQARGYQTEVCRDSDEEDERVATTWSCYCTRTMIPTHGEVVRIQAELDAIGRPLGGHADGWGTFGNGPAAARR
jgi:regulator of RNase E activity RraB